MILFLPSDSPQGATLSCEHPLPGLWNLMMNAITRIDDRFCTGPQISVEDMDAIKAAGFKSVICNRPDNEGGPTQPDHKLLEAAANRVGLKFAYLPVVSGNISDADVADFKNLINELPAPVLAFCRSGARSKTLYERAR